MIHRCDLKSLPKWTKYNIYVRINLLSDIILLDDEVVPTSPICSSKNFLSNLECTLWKNKENGQVRQKKDRGNVGEERRDKALRISAWNGGYFPHRLDYQPLFRKMPERAHPLQKSSLVGKDQKPDQGDD